MSDNSMLISGATQRNWEKLNISNSDKLKSRANKSRSEKCIVPDNYISIDGLESIISQIKSLEYSDIDIFYALCIQKLSLLHNNENVNRFLLEYKRDVNIKLDIPYVVLSDTKNDWLGFLYQTRIPEGKRNIRGQYYTNYSVVNNMLLDVVVSQNKSFLDPCCGTGAFLMNVRAESLSQLFGIDNDEIAVMITKANLIALYPNDKQYPQVYCEDYLDDNIFTVSNIADKRFDYIYTNPPWGVSKIQNYFSDVICSSERSSLFFVKAFKQLKTNGQISFLMPSSLLKVKSHQDFRSFILKNTNIKGLELYKERFNGVFTDFFSIIAVKKGESSRSQSYFVKNEHNITWVTLTVEDCKTEIVLNNNEEEEILSIIEAFGVETLKDSSWALGVVTGDNKNKLKKEKVCGYEPIYTGKDIGKYLLNKPSNYILYDRTLLQQCAKDEYYRCSEKLVYKFISKSLCFAYDNTSSLFLNSANILIPNIKGMSIKTVLAFLNSELFSYYYLKKFSDIKVLKSNLMTLPFPSISEQQDWEITKMVDLVLKGELQHIESINNYIYSLYSLKPIIINKIKDELYGSFDISA